MTILMGKCCLQYTDNNAVVLSSFFGGFGVFLVFFSSVLVFVICLFGAFLYCLPMLQFHPE